MTNTLLLEMMIRRAGLTKKKLLVIYAYFLWGSIKK